jgi:hypothetical protein
VREWVDARNGEREVGVIFVCQPETSGFDAKTEASRVAVEWLVLGCCIKEFELSQPQDALVHPSSFLPRAHDLDYITERRDDEQFDGLRKYGTADNGTCL